MKFSIHTFVLSIRHNNAPTFQDNVVARPSFKVYFEDAHLATLFNL